MLSRTITGGLYQEPQSQKSHVFPHCPFELFSPSVRLVESGSEGHYLKVIYVSMDTQPFRIADKAEFDERYTFVIIVRKAHR